MKCIESTNKTDCDRTGASMRRNILLIFDLCSLVFISGLVRAGWKGLRLEIRHHFHNGSASCGSIYRYLFRELIPLNL
jgi:hypothetical protein